jgi:hypothetical protein
MIGVELSKTVGRIRPRLQEGLEAKQFRGKARKDIKGVSGNGIRLVGNDGKAVPGIRSLIGRGVYGWGSKRKVGVGSECNRGYADTGILPYAQLGHTGEVEGTSKSLKKPLMQLGALVKTFLDGCPRHLCISL